MLVVSPLRSDVVCRKEEIHVQGDGFGTAHAHVGTDEFTDFSDGNLLESIDFDDLFLGIDDGDVLPDLEMDPELLGELSVSGSGEESDVITNASFSNSQPSDTEAGDGREEEEKDSGSVLESNSRGQDEIVSTKKEPLAVSRGGKDSEKSSKSSSGHSKNNHGKRKVDWTPELHRRFVQAVEQLGVDKAVPSRILEIMGIDCLTRHNIASHLQKYRSHRKHLLAREAEAARWTHMRQIYGGAGAGAGKRTMSPWVPPTMGFPPVTPIHHHFRPLHVWGHPPMEQPVLHIWPKHLVPHSPSHPPQPPPAWAPSPPPPPPDPSYWSHHRVPSAVTPGTPCYPQPLPPPARYATPTVPGFPPHAMYKVDPGIGVPSAPSTSPHSVFDLHPSKESIDAAIGDVMSKPWLPLPLGLKPPSVDGVLVELHRQGVSNIPPSCA